MRTTSGTAAARGHNGLARNHRFQEHDAENLLNTGQAEDVRVIIFLGQSRDRDVAEPAYDRREIQLKADPLEPFILRSVPYNANLELRNGLPQTGRGSQQNIQTLARIEPAFRKNGELSGVRRTGI